MVTIAGSNNDGFYCYVNSAKIAGKIPAILVPVDPEAARVWRMWAHDQPVSGDMLSDNILPIVQAAEYQCVRAIADVMSQSPELGDKFVEIRSDAMKNHSNPLKSVVR
jgi:hypothetical protein